MQVIDTFVHSVQLIAGAIFVVLAAAGAAGLYFFAEVKSLFLL